MSVFEFFASLFMHLGVLYRYGQLCHSLSSLRVCLCTLVYYIQTTVSLYEFFVSPLMHLVYCI